MAVRRGVSSNQEVRENASRARIAMLSAPFRVAPECSAGRSPHRFTQMPIDRNSRVFKEPIHEIFSATGTSDQFGKDRGGHSYISLSKGRFQCSLHSQV